MALKGKNMEKTTKKVKEVKETKEERQYKILTEGVYEIFDRTPIGSIDSSELIKLS